MCHSVLERIITPFTVRALTNNDLVLRRLSVVNEARDTRHQLRLLHLFDHVSLHEGRL